MLGSDTVPAGTTMDGVTFGVFNDNDKPIKCGGTEHGCTATHTYAPGAEITCARMTIHKVGTKWVGTSKAVLPIAVKYKVKEVAGNKYYPLSDTYVVKLQLIQDIDDGQIISVRTGKGVGTNTSKQFTRNTFQTVDSSGTKKHDNGHSFMNKPVMGGVTIQKADYLKQSDDAHGDTNLSGAKFILVPTGASSTDYIIKEHEKDPADSNPPTLPLDSCCSQQEKRWELITTELGQLDTREGGYVDGWLDAKITKYPEWSTLNALYEKYKNNKTGYDKVIPVTLVTDEHGNAVTKSNSIVSYGDYYMIEVEPATGYQLNKSYVGLVQIRVDGEIVTPKNVGGDVTGNTGGAGNIGGNDNVQQQIYTGGLKIQKLDYERDSVENADKDMSGFKFAIINGSTLNSSVNYQHKIIERSELSGDNVVYDQVKSFYENNAKDYVMEVITTDANGIAQTSKHTCSDANCWYKGRESLPYGTYYVVEVDAPEGYDINTNWVGKLTVRKDGYVYGADTEAAAVPGEWKILHNNGAYQKLRESGDMGDYSWVKVDDYHRTNNHSYSFAPKAIDQKAVRDQIWRGGVSVQKTDVEMHDATTQGTSTFKGAEFTIYNASNNPTRNYRDKEVQTAKSKLPANPTWEQIKALSDDYVMETIVTDENGRATTGQKHLPYGTYYMIETKSPDGYFIQKNFIGKIVIRDDGVMLELGENATARGSVFTSTKWQEICSCGDKTCAKYTVPDQVRRGDIYFLKVNIDGVYKPYIPFLISAVQINSDGTESIIEQHVIVSNAGGVVDTFSRPRYKDGVLNPADALLDTSGNSKVKDSVTKEDLIEASKYGVWFQGNSTEYLPRDYDVKDDMGALYQGYYRIQELQCDDNKDLEENLVNSDLIWISNTSVDDNTPMIDWQTYKTGLDWEQFKGAIDYYGNYCVQVI